MPPIYTCPQVYASDIFLPPDKCLPSNISLSFCTVGRIACPPIYWPLLLCLTTTLCRTHHRQVASKHLKSHLDPPVGDGHVFWIKGGQLDLPVGDVTFFGSKEVSWIPLLVTSRFWIKGGQLGSRVSNVTFLDQRRSVGALCQ